MANNVSIENSPTEKIVTIEFDDSRTIITTNKRTGKDEIDDQGPAPCHEKAYLADIEININTQKLEKKGGKISGIFSPLSEEVIFFTNSPGCYWYWNRRYWIWR